MKINKDIITILSDDLSPIKVQKPFQKLAVYAGVAWVCTMIVAFGCFSLRGDLQKMMLSKIFIFSTVISFILCMATFYSIIVSSIPGRKSAFHDTTILGFLGAILGLGLLFWPNESAAFGKELAKDCTLSVMALGAASFLAFLYAVKRAAPEHPIFTGTLCGVAATAMGATVLSFICPNEHAYHLLVWHLLFPCIFFVIIGQIIGRTLLRW